VCSSDLVLDENCKELYGVNLAETQKTYIRRKVKMAPVRRLDAKHGLRFVFVLKHFEIEPDCTPK